MKSSSLALLFLLVGIVVGAAIGVIAADRGPSVAAAGATVGTVGAVAGAMGVAAVLGGWLLLAALNSRSKHAD